MNAREYMEEETLKKYCIPWLFLAALEKSRSLKEDDIVEVSKVVCFLKKKYVSMYDLLVHFGLPGEMTSFLAK